MWGFSRGWSKGCEGLAEVGEDGEGLAEVGEDPLIVLLLS